MTLIPATSYAIERVGILYGSVSGGYNPATGGRRFAFDAEPSEYRALSSRTRCDAQGYFKFENVSDGKFYVSTVIVWKVSEYSMEGGALAQLVAVSGGEVKDVVLAPR